MTTTQREALLPDEPAAEPEPTSSAEDHGSHTAAADTSDEEPPFSLRNEVRFFFGQGLPLCRYPTSLDC